MIDDDFDEDNEQFCRGCKTAKSNDEFAIKTADGKRFKLCDECRPNARPSIKCPECPCIMSEPYMDAHLRDVHGKKKICPHCGKGFALTSVLNVHINAVCKGIKNYKCTQCARVFSKSSHLSDHITAAHVNIPRKKIENYPCLQCDKVFARSDTLREHTKGAHGDVYYGCLRCGFKTTWKACLKQHAKTCTGTEHISSGEYRVREILDTQGIAYKQQMKFADCKDMMQLPFDFHLPDHNMCIEYDGEQHFRPVARWGGDEAFQRIQSRDAIKTAYCATNNIRLLRIKYTDIKRAHELITNFLAVSQEPLAEIVDIS
jgi:very-short-patch-repair endonuclease